MTRSHRSVALLAGFLLQCTALLQSNVQAATPQASHPAARPDIRSNVALIIDTNSSSVLYARNAATPRPIASLTKLMTALIVVESGQPLGEMITVAKEDRDGTQGAASRLAVGAQLTRGDLLHLALMASDNRAAHALARTYPGGKVAALAAMNSRARLLGMTSTKFSDPSGLSPLNVASANDIAKLIVAASSHETIRSFSTDMNHTVFAKHALEFRNTNYLVAKPDWDIELQKTGYTSEAGQCLAMKTTIQGRPLIIVLLDSFGKYTRTADARRIRKWLETQAPTQIARTASYNLAQ